MHNQRISPHAGGRERAQNGSSLAQGIAQQPMQADRQQDQLVAQPRGTGTTVGDVTEMAHTRCDAGRAAGDLSTKMQASSGAFPALHGSLAASREGFNNVPCRLDIELLREGCENLGVEVETALKTAWGILLQGYMLVDNVCFQFARGEDAGEQVQVIRRLDDSFSSLACRVQAHTLENQENCDTLLFIKDSTFPNKNYSEGEHTLTLTVDITTKASVVTFSTSIMTKVYAEKLARSFTHIIDAMITTPEAKVANFSIVNTEDVDLETYNALPSPIQATLHGMILDRVSQQPDAPAIDAWDGKLTYRELQQRASSLADQLRRRGLCDGVYVGFCFSKSLWAGVTMLACLMTGAIFVPFDPRAPPERWREVLKAVDARTALVSPEYASAVSQVASTISISEASLSLQTSTAEAQSAAISPSDICFVLFTSGSTGKPKGIVMEHQTMTSLSTAHPASTGVGPATRVFNFAAYTFDVGVMDHLLSWIRGACVCVPGERERMDDLAGAITRARADWVVLTPTVADLLDSKAVPTLKTLVSGGEVNTVRMAERWKNKVHLWSSYGPTEVAICALNERLGYGPGPTSLGKPVNSAFWVVDPTCSQKLVPDGCVGELMIQGPLLARGYVKGSAEEAHTRWITGARLPKGVPIAKAYLTGDLVRKTIDGRYDFVGRKDSQVKIRGQRIELGDIEANMEKLLPLNVSGTVQVMSGDESQILCALLWYHNSTDTPAYVPESLDSEENIMIDALENGLKKLLPQYMIPKYFFLFHGTPEQTHSDKVNRRQLLGLAEQTTKRQRQLFTPGQKHYVAPTTGMEKLLRDLWAEVLHLDADMIGKRDSFFGLGGDSVSAIRLVEEAQGLDVPLSVGAIFETPTLDRMAGVAAAQLELKSHEGSPSHPGGTSHEISSQVVMAAFSSPSTASSAIMTPTAHTYGSSVGSTNGDMLGLESPPPAQPLETSTGLVVQDVYPCTPLQEGLMAITSKKPGAYIDRYVYAIPSHIDSARLMAAWEETVQASDVLRTRLVILEEGMTLQTVVQDNGPSWNLEEKTLRETLADMQAITMTYGERLCEYALAKSKDGSRHLVLVLHHAVYDGFAMLQIMDMLQQAYRQPGSLTHRPFNGFVDHVINADQEAASHFWTDYLAGSQPAQFPRPSLGEVVQSSASYKATISVSSPSNPAITKASLIQSAWSIVLARYCDTDDISFGMTVSGRNASLPQVNEVVGPTIATIPVRVHLPRRLSVTQHLRDMQSQSAQVVPFEQFGLQNIAKVSKDAELACQFTSLLVLQPAEIVDHKAGGEAVCIREEFHDGAYFDYPLVLQAVIREDTVDLMFSYDSRAMQAWQCEAMSHQLEHVMAQLAAVTPDDALTLAEIGVAGPWDQARLQRWKMPKRPIIERCLHDLVTASALERPDQEAIYTSGRSLTYSELHAASNAVANELISHGVPQKSIIPICFEKSAAAVVAILGILKAGCAYLPLDPAHPLERKREYIQQVQATVLLTSPGSLASCHGLDVEAIPLSLDQLLTLSNNVIPTQTPVTSPGDTLCILFTSGSTGKPKGVVLQHSSICTSIASFAAKHAFGPYSRLLQFATYTFDASIYEMFLPLVVGGATCVPTNTERFDDMAGFMNASRTSAALLTPSFVKTLDPEALPSLETLVLIGEAPTRDVVETWRGRVRLVNGYGPTETTVICASHTYGPTGAVEFPTAIGTMVHADMAVVEVDDYHVPCPVGCVGELLVQGPTIAEGYFVQPERAASAFVDLTVQNVGGCTRWYKTGDMVRYIQDGTLVYVGRKDTQIKLRGQRLEPGEIEYALQTAQKVNVAAVHLSHRPSGDILVAFIELDVPTEETDDDIIDLDEETKPYILDIAGSVRSRLPGYMVPSYIIPLGNMPTISSTKLDRHHLQSLADSLPLETLSRYSTTATSDTGVKTQPLNEVEKTLQLLFSEILHLDPLKVGRDDSFLHLGGDSISAVRLSALARKHGLDLAVTDIFRDARLFSMAVVASQGQPSISPSTANDQPPFSLLTFNIDRQTALSELAKGCNLPLETIEDAYPCTPFQEGLMALGVRNPSSYIAKHVYRLRSGINIERFKTAWAHVCSLAESPRLRICKVDQDYVQVLVGGSFEWEDTKGMTLGRYLEHAKGIRMTYGDRLTRAAIIDSAEGAYFVWVNHHAIYDGWTVSLILSAVHDAYQGLDLAPFKPYASFIKYVTERSSADSRIFWQNYLHGACRTDFPPSRTVNASTKEGSTRIARRSIAFPPLADTSITKATVLRTAWALVLARYSAISDVCFGFTTSGRNAPVGGVDSMAGTVVATVPVRVKINPAEPVADMLRRVQDQAMEMVPHEHYGLQNILKLDEDIRQAADVSTLLTVQSEEQASAIEGSGSDLMTQPEEGEYSYLDTIEGYFTVPLVVQCFLQGEKVTIELTYDSSVLQGSSMEAMCLHYENVLSGLLTALEHGLAVEQVSLTGSWDVEKAVGLNSRVKETVVDSCLHTLVGEWAARQPSREALYSTERSFTYAELDKLSSLLACHLIQQGVTLETVVAICIEKSAWTAVAMLGVLKAGGVFMALEVEHPVQRRRALIEQAKAAYLITSVKSQIHCQGLTDHTIELSDTLSDQLSETLDSESILANAPAPSPANTAYILFTSGSTGTPKGIIFDHGAIASSMTSHGSEFGIKSTSRVLQFASYAFDASISEIFTTLLFGGTVCIPTPAERLEDLPAFINRAGVDVAMLTPSFLSTMTPTQVPGLKTVILGGETPTKSTLDTWYSHLDVLINGYAPAECCIYALAHTYTSRNAAPNVIGRGMHANCWIVDPTDPHTLAPVGCVGELVIHTNALGRGYIGDEAKTAQVFLDDLAFLPGEQKKPHYRFYLTGDLVRYTDLESGEIEYLGRKDTQVKVRGQRIELGEVEYAIKSVLPDVEHMAVEVMREDIDGRKRESLIAFISFSDSKEGSQAMSDDMKQGLQGLVSTLQGRLPSFMVPSLFMPLAEMPFLSSMKIDRKALRALVKGLSPEEYAELSLAGRVEHEPPVTNAEVRLRDVWAAVLKMPAERIGRRDNFFSLGGDSIAAVDLVQRLRGSLAIAQIFQALTLAAMAECVVDGDFEEEGDVQQVLPFSILGLEPAAVYAIRQDACRVCQLHDLDDVEDVMPCTPLQEAFLLTSLKQPGAYMNTVVFRLGAGLQLERFKMAWQDTVRACENLRTRFLVDEDFSTRTGRAGDKVKLLQVVTRSIPDWDKVEGLSLETYFRQPGLREVSSGSSLCRYALLEDEAGGRPFFVLTIHHAMYDLWTLQIVIKTLNDKYHNSGEVILPHYRNFIQYIASQDENASREYWTEQLWDAQKTEFPRLPTLEDTVKKTRTKKARIPLPQMPGGITAATIVRAAWGLVLSRYCDSNDVCFGAVLSGRLAPLAGVSRMPGPTISTVPVRLRIDKGQPLVQFLRDVQAQATEMIPHEQFGLQRITKEIPGAKDPCNVRNVLVLQPVERVAALVGGGGIVKEESESERVKGLWEDQMQDVYDKPLILNCAISGSELDIAAVHDESVLTEGDMNALVSHLGEVVRQLVRDDKTVGEVSLTGEWDLEQAVRYNSGVKESVVEECLHDLVARWAAQMPDHEAIYSSKYSLTYSQLDEASSKLAAYLHSLGVRVGTVVPVCFEKSAWTVVAMLAILKVGGIFMPLDPTHPEDRRRSLIQQVDANYLLASTQTGPAHLDMVETVIEVSPDLITHLESPQNSWESPSPTDAAYILFTSGSTGAPKGIIVEHQAISSSIASHGPHFGVTPSSRTLQFASYVFDVSISEIFTTLALGGTVCVPDDTERIQNIVEFINRAGVNIAMLTPSFVTTFTPEQVPSLKVLILGGEAPTRQNLLTWQPHVRLLNGYAPAECCIYALTHEYRSPDEVPTILGTGLHHKLWIVEPHDHDNLAPIGCIGELILQGTSIGRGYINAPDKTSAAFLDSIKAIPDDLIKEGDRFYKSGDLVRYDKNGEIEYLGRKDTQVKLRGQRIELGEVEHNVGAALPEAVFVAAEVVRRDGRETLVVFAQFAKSDKPGGEVSIMPMNEVMRRRLRVLVTELESRMPRYMVPQVFVPLHKMPFLSSLKIDRKKLQGMVGALSRQEFADLALPREPLKGAVKPKGKPEALTLPLTANELLLRELWAEVLSVDQGAISADTNFFDDLHGNTNAAKRLSKMATVKGLRISVAKTVHYPTLSAMAKVITTEASHSEQSSRPFELVHHIEGSPDAGSIRLDAQQQCGLDSLEDVEDVYPCTNLQLGMVASTLITPAAYTSTNIYRLSANVDLDRFRDAWERTVMKCVNLRTRFFVPAASTGKPVQVVVRKAVLLGEPLRQDIVSYVRDVKLGPILGSPTSAYALVESTNQVEKKEEGKVLYFAFTFHHAISDLWSVHLILSTLNAAYFQETGPAMEPYSRFVHHSLGSSQGSKDYWISQLAGAKKSDFPHQLTKAATDPQRGPMKVLKATLPLPATNKLQSNITMATVLRTAWALLVAKYSDSPDVCFGTTVSGRFASLAGISRISGPTLATVPLRLQLDQKSSLNELLRTVQRQGSAMIPHEQFGLQEISKVLPVETREVCHFSSLLVVQPNEQVSSLRGHELLEDVSSSGLFERVGEAELQGYFTYPLVVNLAAGDGEVEMLLYYDSEMLGEGEAEGVKHHLGAVIGQLIEEPVRLVGDVSLLVDWDVSNAVTAQGGESVGLWAVERHDSSSLVAAGCVGELAVESSRLLSQEGSQVTLRVGDETRRVIRTGMLVRRNFNGTFTPVGQQVVQRVKEPVDEEAERLLSSLLQPESMDGVLYQPKQGHTGLTALIWFTTSSNDSPLSVQTITPDHKRIANGVSFSMSLSLPSHRLPGAFIFFNKPPSLVTGSLNRHDLFATAATDQIYRLSDHDNSPTDEDHLTPMEKQMQKLWSSVLNIPSEQITKNDNFLHIGGDSIAAIQLVSLARHAGLEVSIVAIFRDPRLFKVAASVVKSQPEASTDLQPFAPPPPISQETLQQISQQCGDLTQEDRIEDMYPCTPMQEALLALGVKQPTSYIGQYVYQLGQEVDIDRFKAAWEETVRVSSNLRTRVVFLDGQYLQVVVDASIEWHIFDHTDKAAFLASDLAKKAMGYGTGLSRYAILGNKYFVWTLHHAVFDGFSMGVIMDRLHRSYRGLAPPPIVPFSSFVRHFMVDAADYHDVCRRYWDKQLDGAQRTAFPDVSGKVSTAQIFEAEIPLERAGPSSPVNSVTVATVMRTAWAILLARYCETRDVCFASVVSGRQAAEPAGLSHISGPLVATVPVRINLQDRQETALHLLQRVQEQALEMITYEQYGMQNIGKVNKHAAEATQVSCLFGFASGKLVRAREEGHHSAILDLLDQDHHFSGYFTHPLDVQVTLSDEWVLGVSVSYAEGAIAAFQVEALAHQLHHVAQQLMKASDTTLVGDVTTASAWDLEQATMWNRQVDIKPVEATAHELIAAQVALHPDKEAVYSTERSFTYHELDSLSTRLAVYLRQKGVTTEQVVAFCFEKSPWAVIAVVAIAKAGGIFMPLDAKHPLSYRAGILAKAKARIVLVTPTTLDQCQGLDEELVVVSPQMDCLQHTNNNDPTGLLLVDPPRPDSALYLLFSSGSTGTPKGIVVTHRSFFTSMSGQAHHFGITQHTRLFHFATYVFDVSVADMLVPLTVGGTVCVPTEAERMQSTAEFINEARCTLMHLTPSFLLSLDPGRMPTVETVTVGGEAPTAKLLEKWFSEERRLINVYGPAEASVDAAFYPFDSADDPANVIGRGVKNYTWVVDADDPGRLAPLGAVGELVLQSHCIARGYLEDPERTAASFLDNLGCLPEDVVSEAPSFYRTGDLVQYVRPGVLAFKGRRDTQVKLRGQRMELGDIEHKIAGAYEGVEFAVVDILKRDNLEALVAFITFKRGTQKMEGESGMEAVRELLKTIAVNLASVLPPHMIPSYFIPLDSMPHTSSDKIHRKALREMIDNMSSQDLLRHVVSQRASFRECATETEREVRGLWSRVLAMEEGVIGADDNFYDLGGDSIRVVTLMKMIQDRYGVSLGLGLLNSRKSNIAFMAGVIEQQMGGSEGDDEDVDLYKEITAITSAPWVEHLTDSQVCQPRATMPIGANILLTGATGFLGTQILRQTLQMDNIGSVIALVRARDTTHGFDRVKQSALTAGWWDPTQDYANPSTEKLQIWTGDLSSSELGLTTQQWDRVRGDSSDKPIHAIIHNGAIVNWTADYEKLKPDNLTSTISLLQAALSSPACPKMVFISGGGSTPIEMDRAEASKQLRGDIGYSQTKFVAESAVQHVASALSPSQNRVSTVKPGVILGTRSEGVANTDDFIWRVVATAAQIGHHPVDEPGTWITMSDAGAVAVDTIAQLTESEIVPFRRIDRGLTSEMFWATVGAEVECAPVTWENWTEKALERMNKTGERHPLWPVQHFLGGLGAVDEEAQRGQEAEVTKGVVEAVRMNVRYLKRIGFLDGRNGVEGQGAESGVGVFRRGGFKAT